MITSAPGVTCTANCLDHCALSTPAISVSSLAPVFVCVEVVRPITHNPIG